MTNLTLPTNLNFLLSPKSVAVIGASEDLSKFGGRALNLLVRHGYAGEVYPINPNRETLLGLKAYPSIAGTPSVPEIAIMAVSPAAVREAVIECAAAGTRVAIVITAKFSDAGPEGLAREEELVAVARRAGMRLVGPNCLGVVSPINDLVLCASPALMVDTLPKGRIGFVSQSGALMTTLFDHAASRGIGFSHCFSIGNQADLDLCDYIDHLIDDPLTSVICCYIEGLKQPLRFIETAARAHAAGKPLLVLKAGRTASGAAAAFSHTASLVGSYESFAAACESSAVLEMDDPHAMLLLAAALVRHPACRPQSVAVFTTSGGGGAVSVDRLVDQEIPIATLSNATRDKLLAHYPPNVAGLNPIDVGASIDGAISRGGPSIEFLAEDENSDLILSVITTAPDIRTLCVLMEAASVAARQKGHDKPHLIVLMPGQAAAGGREMLREAGALYTDNLDEAIRAISAWRRLAHLKVYSPAKRPADLPVSLDVPSGIVDEAATKALLASYGVPVNSGKVAADASEAAAFAATLQSPFVVKIVSRDIVHKSDVGGVVLGLETPDQVREAVLSMSRTIGASCPAAAIDGYLVQQMHQGKVELLIGGRNDPQFGPMVIVGAGGVLVEMLSDVAVARCPIDVVTARELLQKLAIAPLLAGFRNSPPLDIDSVAEAISRTSWLLHDLGDRFEELDINPLLVDIKGRGCVAVDGRMLCSNDVVTIVA